MKTRASDLTIFNRKLSSPEGLITILALAVVTTLILVANGYIIYRGYTGLRAQDLDWTHYLIAIEFFASLAAFFPLGAFLLLKYW